MTNESGDSSLFFNNTPYLIYNKEISDVTVESIMQYAAVRLNQIQIQ